MIKYIKDLDLEIIAWISLLILGLLLYGSMAFTKLIKIMSLKQLKRKLELKKKK